MKPVGAQIGEKLQHRLVDAVGIGTLEARMARAGEPVGDGLREYLRRHAGMGGCHDLEQTLLARCCERLDVAFEHRLERLRVLPFRVLRRERLHPIERKGELEIDRLLGPQRAVIVEGGDAFGLRHEVGAAFRRGPADEIEDRLLYRAVVPRRQRIRIIGQSAPGPACEGRGEHTRDKGPPIYQGRTPLLSVRTQFHRPNLLGFKSAKLFHVYGTSS